MGWQPHSPVPVTHVGIAEEAILSGDGTADGGSIELLHCCSQDEGAGLPESFATLRRGEVEQLQLHVALQGPLQVPQLPVHPGQHRRAAPQLLGYVTRGALQSPAGKEATPGQRDTDGGPLRGVSSMVGAIPLLAVRFQPLEKPQPFGEMGLGEEMKVSG